MAACHRSGPSRLVPLIVPCGVLLAALGGCVAPEDGRSADIVQVPAAASIPETAAADTAAPTQGQPESDQPESDLAKTAPMERRMVPTSAGSADTGTVEQITVVGDSLSGLWKVSSPKRLGMDVGLFSGVRVHYSGETGDRDICELRQTGVTLDARCLRLARTARGSIDGDKITLRAWVGPATLILKATAPGGTSLRGTIGGGALGQQLTGGIPIRATKLKVPPESGDRPTADRPSTPVLRAVLDDIAHGHLSTGRYAPEAAARLDKEFDDLRAAQARLGPLERVTYLDQLLPRHPFDPQERPLEVYRVDYAQGALLCGISLGPPADVADFLCR